MTTNNISVLVVCSGNTCRSPIGEAVLKHIAQERGLDITVDSAGTSVHNAGQDADPRAIAICNKKNIPIEHKARQVSVEDFTNFTHMLAVGEANLRALMMTKPPGAMADVRLWGSYHDGRPISDPYWGGPEQYEDVFNRCVELAKAFLDSETGKDICQHV